MQRQLRLQAQFLEEQRSEQRVAFGFLALGCQRRQLGDQLPQQR